MELIQTVRMTAMRPITKIWVRRDNIHKQEADKETDLPEMIEEQEKDITCMGQFNVQMTYA